MTVLAVVSLVLAAFPALMYLRNRPLFRPPPAADSTLSPPRISVLIPARNEETSIGPCVRSVLANAGVELEVIVLDDHSTDRTAAVVREIATTDPRVRVETAPSLPAGWCGKQAACFALAKLARFDVLTFLDADVRLSPDALARMDAFRRQSGAGLVSGFPRQETGTLLEKLVIPLINWLLVCYLPLQRMRASLQPGLGAGCGQWFLTTRDAYEKVGGHAAVRTSLHDGVMLPRAYRRAGLMTDICDATELATCRMYRSAGQVWFGLAKNAREGLGAPVLIWVWTLLLAGGHVLPWFGCSLTLADAVNPAPEYYWMANRPGVNILVVPGSVKLSSFVLPGLFFAAGLLSLLPRIDSTRRFRGSWLGAFLHPLGVSALLAIQWYATVRTWLGRPVGWKGRAHPTLPSGIGALSAAP